MVHLAIFRMRDDAAKIPGALVYHNHQLFRVEGKKRKGGKLWVQYRRIGKINIDRQMREAERRSFREWSRA